MSKTNLNQYIDLRINGQLFPTWIMSNFKKYKLPDFSRTEGEDPCKTKIDEKKELRTYQKFLGQYLSYDSPYREILLYHGFGAGKTVSSINIMNVLYTAHPMWNFFLLIKASLRDDPWIKDLEKCTTEQVMSNIYFVHYDSPYADKDFFEAVKKTDSAKDNLYIIDEVHNFISNVYTNIKSKVGRRAQAIYEYIQQQKKDQKNTRIICLSGSPAINFPYELCMLFNLLRPGIFPKNEERFMQLYTNGRELTSKNMFQRNILGLVSYYIGATPDLYPEKTINYIDVEMSKYQRDIYETLEEQEKKHRGDYRTKTRQASNFVFPHINSDITGINRPRASKFKLSDDILEDIDKGKDKDKLLLSQPELKAYLNTISKFIGEFNEFLYKKKELDKEKKHTIYDDIKVYHEIAKKEGKVKLKEFMKKDRSEVLKILYESSAKMTLILLNITMTNGTCLVYSNFVRMEGIEIFKIYLEQIGFKSIYDKAETKHRYAEFTGEIEKRERKRILSIFNNLDNYNGSKIKVIFISMAGAEGINLSNVKQVHITEPYWHENRIEQMIARAIRYRSHCALPPEERKVEVYRYKSIRKENWTTDQYIEDIAKTKNMMLRTFLDSMKEVAVDCHLFKGYNMINNEYSCFQFEEPSLFSKYISPAFKFDINDNIRFDNGSNSVKAVTLKIKVMKIKAVKQLTKQEDKYSYSEPDDYWYYVKPGTIYDYDLYFPIGKLALGDKGEPLKYNDSTYIIDRLIPIPTIV